ncbi:inositol polyphosphate multikinase beta [Gastrolobium bilobum]|uniref:inositol polyphosphate multikinase beta n=1 Tax=Gastrolobium bilobum TaxID=150636 RepID=UPI002AAF160D|nr:inositol polyphosphate multikinase beta [Gastrolobium bilobum]XP_061358572.1 inositol polyphosphate multikinase beta [Gastrolobium bilobum]
MFKVPKHQVAGHQAKDGRLGPLIDDSGKFYKPLQSDERGSNEVAFYTSLFSDSRIPEKILRFFPFFHGTKLVNASNGSGLHPHLVLEDVVSNYTNPSVIDIKIGSRTWHPQASEDYINKCLKKDKETSSIPLGFRISGLKFVGSSKQDSSSSLCWQPVRKSLQNLSAEEVKLVLRKFVSSNSNVTDCVFGAKVFGEILEQLLELKQWFEVQTIFHFYSCSVLMVYEKEEESVVKGKNSGALVKLVDFAHVVDAKGAIDHNFLGGLCSLIKFISDILAGLDDNSVSKDEH